MSDASGAQDPWIGRILAGEFRILRPLGSGGFGAVYLAEQSGVDRQVVVKVIRLSLTESEVVVERFRRESRIVARLSHPNVVQVFTAGQTDDGAHYLVMEYVPGPTLHELLWQEKQLDETRVLRVGEQIAGALAAAHAAGVVHRDLKPANVILTSLPGREELVKVLDFGVAKLLGQSALGHTTGLTATGAIVGTPAYMSPEQVSGHDLDGRSDVYTLGLMLYEMVSGKHPFEAATPVQYILQHLQQPVTPPSVRVPGLRISPEFETILQRCLAKDPRERFASAEALQIALKRVADRLESTFEPATADGTPRDRPIPTASLPPSRAAAAFSRSDNRARNAAVVAILLFAALVAGAVWLSAFLFLEREPAPRPEAARLEPGASLGSAAATDPEPDAGESVDSAEAALPRASALTDSDTGPARADAKPTGDTSTLGERVPIRPDTAQRSPVVVRTNGPHGALLPVGARVAMSTDSLVTYRVDHGVSELAEAFYQHYSRQARIMFNMDQADDPTEPFFSMILPSVETGVHMISIIHEGANQARISYFVR